jgi:hypothetical protein
MSGPGTAVQWPAAWPVLLAMITGGLSYFGKIAVHK